MAALKSDPSRRDAKIEDPGPSGLARVMMELKELAADFEVVLMCADQDIGKVQSLQEQGRRREDIQLQARRLAIAELSTKYTRKSIRRSLDWAESLGKLAEERLLSALESESVEEPSLGSTQNGYFRLYSTDLFDKLGQPTDLRFGTLRFQTSQNDSASAPPSDRTAVELALDSAFFVADSLETLPYHSFSIPESPSLQNRGILSRKWEDGGAFPEYDSWLLFTFLGNGCLKVEIPIEMCADVYGGALRGRENEEVLFWGIFVEDDATS
ncbi:hypothetical protein BDV96DRAFT_614021 [Lophiotrema nucula]|uniref:Uncharacterized protein n=1 Tax=Lophiotrema nucula TaxID=690887 RepID=A0A6A5Z233_9PLEO|nr:hypothetical protein BDV96DRAFT_614021 [Lophiotrema nucula]